MNVILSLLHTATAVALAAGALAARAESARPGPVRSVVEEKVE